MAVGQWAGEITLIRPLVPMIVVSSAVSACAQVEGEDGSIRQVGDRDAGLSHKAQSLLHAYILIVHVHGIQNHASKSWASSYGMGVHKTRYGIIRTLHIFVARKHSGVQCSPMRVRLLNI